MHAGLPDVLVHQDYRTFLREVVDNKSSPFHRNLRSLAVAAGMKSPAAMSMIVNGKRNLSTSAADRLCDNFQVNERRRNYFINLVRLAQSRTPSERVLVEEQLFKLRTAQEKQPLELSRYRFLSRWFYPAIYVMADSPHFESSAEWITSKLVPKVSLKEVKEALGDMKNLGLLQEVDGALRPVRPLLAAANQIAMVAVRRYHESMIELARQSLDLPLGDREIQGITLSFRGDRKEEFVERLSKFRSEMNEAFGSSNDADRVYQLNFQFFPLSEPLFRRAPIVRMPLSPL